MCTRLHITFETQASGCEQRINSEANAAYILGSHLHGPFQALSRALILSSHVQMFM